VLSRKSRTRARDDYWFVLVAIAILTFVIVGAISSIKANIETALNPTAGRQYIIGVKVKSGDTLWTLARRYGAPGHYILDRVDSIARDNGLDSSTALVPGETLQVHVENPAMIAKLERSQRVASAVE